MTMEGLPQSFTPEVIILGVEFSDEYEALSIRYVESRNVAPQAGKKEEVTFNRALLKGEEFDDFMDYLNEFLDIGLRHVRTEGGKQG
jgi:hypothetical protein